jgi:hypothetical protein
MHKVLGAISLLLCSLACGALTNAQKPPMSPLPPAEDFRLMLREDVHSTLPLGPSCDGGEMLLTLACSAFTLTLENRSEHTVRISNSTCSEPGIFFKIKPPGYTGPWSTTSRPGGRCYAPEWVNIRLKPGEKTEYSTRIISPKRYTETVILGEYKLRAEWMLTGCTEAPDGSDCLAPLQDTRLSVPPIFFQEPVTVVSNEITAGSPAFPDLGDLRLALEATLVPTERVKSETNPKCSGSFGNSLDCAVFHYAVRNLGSRAVRLEMNGCPGFIFPEYRVEGSEWKPLGWRRTIVCTLNVPFQTSVLPGGAFEGDFSLRDFDTSLLQAPGEYKIRFSFTPRACPASPDGKFCLTPPENQPAITSNELIFRSPEVTPTPG